MRRITIVFMTTVAAVVLLFSYRTSLHSGHTTAGTVATAAGIVGGDPATPSQSVAPSPRASPSTGASTPSPAIESPSPSPAAVPQHLTVNGDAVDTQWGPVQVQVTLSGSKITAVRVLRQPDGNQRDFEINSYAIPQLKSETLRAQSANIDSVSGASVTSDGYIQSLQSALDLAAGRR
jgi:uncharacterized protein with FMN-binding domain